MTQRMEEYLRREVLTALEMILRDNATLHVFDMDSEGRYVFLMAVVPKTAIRDWEQYFTFRPALQSANAGNSQAVSSPEKSANTKTES